MKKILTGFLCVLFSTGVFAQMQDNPVTQSGLPLAVSGGSQTNDNMVMSGSIELITASNGFQVVNYQTMTGMNYAVKSEANIFTAENLYNYSSGSDTNFLVVEGFGSSIVNQTYYYDGQSSSKPLYTYSNGPDYVQVYWDPFTYSPTPYWVMFDFASADIKYRSSEGVADPTLVTTWVAVNTGQAPIGSVAFQETVSTSFSVSNDIVRVYRDATEGTEIVNYQTMTGMNYLASSDIGSTVQAYDADTAKTDVDNNFSVGQSFGADVSIGTSVVSAGDVGGQFLVGSSGLASSYVVSDAKVNASTFWVNDLLGSGQAGGISIRDDGIFSIFSGSTDSALHLYITNGVSHVTSDAAEGTEIVNYQTMTGMNYAVKNLYNNFTSLSNTISGIEFVNSIISGVPKSLKVNTDSSSLKLWGYDEFSGQLVNDTYIQIGNSILMNSYNGYTWRDISYPLSITNRLNFDNNVFQSLDGADLGSAANPWAYGYVSGEASNTTQIVNYQTMTGMNYAVTTDYNEFTAASNKFEGNIIVESNKWVGTSDNQIYFGSDGINLPGVYWNTDRIVAFENRTLLTLSANPWTVNGTANEGAEIVNYQTMTNHIASGIDYDIVTTGYLESKKSGVYAYLTAPSNTVVTAAGTNYPIAGVFTNLVIENFGAATNVTPGIRYLGTKTQYFEIDWATTFRADESSTTVTFAIAKNGHYNSGSFMSGLSKTAGEHYNLSGTVVLELAEGDEVQLGLTSDGDGDVITVDQYVTTIRTFFH